MCYISTFYIICIVFYPWGSCSYVKTRVGAQSCDFFQNFEYVLFAVNCFVQKQNENLQGLYFSFSDTWLKHILLPHSQLTYLRVYLLPSPFLYLRIYTKVPSIPSPCILKYLKATLTHFPNDSQRRVTTPYTRAPFNHPEAVSS